MKYVLLAVLVPGHCVVASVDPKEKSCHYFSTLVTIHGTSIADFTATRTDLPTLDTGTTPLFRLVSGAAVPTRPSFKIEREHTSVLQRGDPLHFAARPRLAPSKLFWIITMVTPLAILSIVACMLPHRQGGDRRGRNYRIPPAWDPANGRNQSFRPYMADIKLWTILTDLEPH